MGDIQYGSRAMVLDGWSGASATNRLAFVGPYALKRLISVYEGSRAGVAVSADRNMSSGFAGDCAW